MDPKTKTEEQPLSGPVVNGLFSFHFVRTCCNRRRIFLSSSSPQIVRGDKMKTRPTKDDILLHWLLVVEGTQLCTPLMIRYLFSRVRWPQETGRTEIRSGSLYLTMID